MEIGTVLRCFEGGTTAPLVPCPYCVEGLNVQCKSCDDLSLDPAGAGTGQVCGNTPSEPCAEGVTYHTAVELCAIFGMRLCTASELSTGEASETGCNHDTRAVWTSTQTDEEQVTCTENQRVTVNYANQVLRCDDMIQPRGAVRCCADRFPTPGESTLCPSNLLCTADAMPGDVSNLALAGGVDARQSSTLDNLVATLAIDGNANADSCSSTQVVIFHTIEPPAICD